MPAGGHGLCARRGESCQARRAGNGHRPRPLPGCPKVMWKGQVSSRSARFSADAVLCHGVALGEALNEARYIVLVVDLEPGSVVSQSEPAVWGVASARPGWEVVRRTKWLARHAGRCVVVIGHSAGGTH